MVIINPPFALSDKTGALPLRPEDLIKCDEAEMFTRFEISVHTLLANGRMFSSVSKLCECRLPPLCCCSRDTTLLGGPKMNEKS